MADSETNKTVHDVSGDKKGMTVAANHKMGDTARTALKLSHDANNAFHNTDLLEEHEGAHTNRPPIGSHIFGLIPKTAILTSVS